MKTLKKTALLLSLVAIPALAYAYYGDYGRSESNGLLTFVAVITIAWGILNIILFFKIWGMTNDVRKIKQTYCAADSNSNLNGTAIKYYTKKELYGQDAATLYIKEVIEKEYQALGLQPTTQSVEKCRERIEKELGFVLNDANLSLPAMQGYKDYMNARYGKFAPGTKVKVKDGMEICEVSGITWNNKILVKTYAGYEYAFDMDELIIAEDE